MRQTDAINVGQCCLLPGNMIRCTFFTTANCLITVSTALNLSALLLSNQRKLRAVDVNLIEKNDIISLTKLINKISSS